jgi:hypothetical protein
MVGLMGPAVIRVATPCLQPTISSAGNPSIMTTGRSGTAVEQYATSFMGTENPISEGGAWSNNGLDWTNVRTTPGLAFGTNVAPATYDDSIAHLSGFAPDQIAQGTIYKSPIAPRSSTHEVELLLRWATSPHSARGYECNLNFQGSAQIVRWNGAKGDFTVIGEARMRTPRTGDVFKATILGNVIRLYYNDVLFTSVIDMNHASGNPGIGFFKANEAVANYFGFTRFTATSATRQLTYLNCALQ